MYNLQLNNYHLKLKNSTIYTPPEVSEFIFHLLRDKVKKGVIFDPCSGKNSLLIPWQVAGYQTWGNDNDPQLLQQHIPDSDLDFLTTKPDQYRQQTALILCNPPFNGAKPKLAPELWLDKIIELFGKDIPLVLFAPIGLRICNSYHGKRYQKFINGKYPPISSIITLPRTIFVGVEFHTEILLFNIHGLQPHYFFNHHE